MTATSEEAVGRDREIVRRRTRTRFGVSRLTITIVMTQMISLLLLLFGSLSLTQYRDGLIAAKLEGVRAQAQIIADVLAQVAVDENTCVIDSDALAFGDAVGQSVDELSSSGNQTCQLSLEVDDVREVFNRVWDSFEGRVRIFNAPQRTTQPYIMDASVLLLEDVMLREDRIVEEDLPTLEQLEQANRFQAWRQFQDQVVSTIFSNSFRNEAAQITIEDELNLALAASPFAQERGAVQVRVNENGELVASVSIPIRKVQAVYGLVTAEIGGIDDLVREARFAIFPLFGFACAAAILSSLMLTAMIAQPIRQLARAADRVREGIAAAGRARIPQFTNRRDEIGELSKSLKSMTQTIYARIEAIESFAADVSHELKNPLTSIRSATETLDIAKAPEAREKLMGVIKKDVARMDRLITDISNASRLDAELARDGREAVDLSSLLKDIVQVYTATQKENDVAVVFEPHGADSFVLGSPSALGQVFRNLIDNARSFSPDDGRVRVRLSADPVSQLFRIFVDDEGPGIPDDKLEAIFKRFYTQRPKGAAFGNNSGLGLAISRQIVNAHGGRIYAENRDPNGARFVVELPAA